MTDSFEGWLTAASGRIFAGVDPCTTPTVRVLGLGSVLRGRIALGPWVIQQLEAEYEFPEGVSLVDVGTPGLDLVPYVSGPTGVVLVDALNVPGTPGEIRVYDREQLLGHSPRQRLSPDASGLTEALIAVQRADPPPRFVRLVGVVPGSMAIGVRFSPGIGIAVPLAAQAVVRELALLGFSAGRRRAVSRPAPWWEVPAAEPPVLASR